MIVRQLLTQWGFRVDTRALKKMEKDIKNLKRSLTIGFDAIKSSLRQTAFLMVGITAGLGIFLRQAGKFEQAEIAFETMLGSAERAATLLKDITQFARKTPFQLPDLIEASKRVLAFGFSMEEVIPTLSTLGNIAAGVGREKLPQLLLAFGQVRAATKLRGQELRQFTEAGVPLLEIIAQQQGIAESAVFGLVSAGKVSFEDVRKALESLTKGSGRFADLMIKQSKSFLGILSNLLDFLNIIAIDIGKKLLPAAKEMALQIIDWIEANEEMIKQDIGEFMLGMLAVIKFLIFFFRGMTDAVRGMTVVFGGLGSALKIVVGLFAFFLAAKLLFGLGVVIITLGKMALAWKTMGNAALVAQIKAIAFPILVGLAFVALGLILEDIQGFFTGKDSLTGAIIRGLDDLQASFEKSFPIMGKVVRAFIIIALTPLRAILTTVRALAGALGALSQGDFAGAFEAIKGGFKDFLAPIINADKEFSFAESVGLGRRSTLRQGALGAKAQAEQDAGKVFTREIRIGSQTFNISVPEGTNPDLVGTAVQKGVVEHFDREARKTQRAFSVGAKF